MEIRVEILDGRIAAKPFPDRRFPGDLDMAKAVPGARWNKESRYWHYPLAMTSCRILREVYSDMLQIGPALAAWYRNEQAKTSYMKEFAGQADTELHRIPEVAPVLDAAMASRTYQRVGARFLAMNRNVLLADEPTLGKTIQYLAGIVEGANEEGVHLIVAPKSSLKTTWANEVFKWTDFHPFWMPDGKDNRKRMLDLFFNDEHPSRFLIINPEMLQTKINHWCSKCEKWAPNKAQEKQYRNEGKMWWPLDHFTDAHDTKPKVEKQDWPELFDIEWNSICVDEAHKSLLGNRGGKKTQAAEGFVRLRMAPNGMKIASTGTPLKGKAMNFWSVFNWLAPDTYRSKWAWAESYLKITDNGFGKVIGDLRPEREQALYDSLATLMLRRTKREVQPDLPEDLYLDHWVDLEGEHLKQYMELVSEGEAEIGGGSISTKGLLDEFTRQKRFSFGRWVRGGKDLVPDPAHAPKLDLLVDLLAKRGVTGNPDDDFRLEGAHKYIVGSQFTTILDFIEQQLQARGIPTVKITGAVTSKNREWVVEEWQNNPDGPRVMLVSTMAGGTALTLDAMCDEMFILDETWVRDDQFQLEGRIRNRDVEKRVAVRTFHYIRTRDTIEEEIAASGLSQDEFQKTLLDRSRGLKIKKRELQK